MHKTHTYQLTTQWTGNKGSGTSSYTAYDRSMTTLKENKPALLLSADPAFRGDQTRYNPEELLLASLSSCHMLWYLHLCSAAGVIVVDYTDNASGEMEETSEGGGRFTSVTLHPEVVVKDAAMLAQANALHAKAHALCFIANSVNFPVLHEAACKVG
jgi:organic hydroperoxide reductase OsmC/OhrA